MDHAEVASRWPRRGKMGMGDEGRINSRWNGSPSQMAPLHKCNSFCPQSRGPIVSI